MIVRRNPRRPDEFGLTIRFSRPRERRNLEKTVSWNGNLEKQAKVRAERLNSKPLVPEGPIFMNIGHKLDNNTL